MKMLKKITSMLLAGTMLFGALAGCGSEKETASGEITHLKMILVGEKPSLYDEIYGKLNEMLREDIGAEVEIEYINYSDANQKYPLLFSTGENFDIIFAADWLNFNREASKNSFMEITDDMLKENAPKTYEALTENYKNQASVNGKLFMIPNTAIEYETFTVLLRGDLRKKYGMDEIESIKDFEDYLTAVAENEKEIIPMVDLAGMNIFVSYASGEMYLSAPPSTEVMYKISDGKLYKRPFDSQYEESVKRTREFVDRGIIPADISVNKTVGTMFENGRAATYVKNLETTAGMAKKLRASHPEWDVELHDFSQGVNKVPNAVTANGLALNRTTKNVEKSLQFIELLRNDKRYFDLTWYGVEGKHWKAEGDNGYVSLNADLPKEQQYSPSNVWGWKNQPMLRTDVNEVPEKAEIFNRWVNEETVESDIRGFVFDDTNVKTELTSVTNVASQYGGPLYKGMVEADKIDSSLKEYQKKLGEAGYDKLYDEIIKQYNEYHSSLEK